MSPLIDEYYFGGRREFYTMVFNSGLLRQNCPICGLLTIGFQYVADQNFPKTYCYNCSRRVPSCRNGSIFDLYHIEHMPAFFFLMKCVALRVSTQAATVLSGLDAETTRRYISIIRTVMAHTMTRTYRDWEGKLGGPHLVVEIDEAFLTKRKYHVGRQMPNESTIVFGITEREGGPTKIEDVQLYNYLIEKETWRSGEPVVIGQQQWHQSFNICPDADRVHNDLGDGVHEHLTAMDEVPLDNGLVIEENTTQIVIGEGEDDDWEHEDSTPETNMSQPRNETTGRRAFRFNKALEAVEKKIFGPKERRGPKRTLFFVVPDRSAETLIPIVRKYVRPGTFIFSDKWMAYWQLRDGYFHFVVVHKKTFCAIQLLQRADCHQGDNQPHRENVGWVAKRHAWSQKGGSCGAFDGSSVPSVQNGVDCVWGELRCSDSRHEDVCCRWESEKKGFFLPNLQNDGRVIETLKRIYNEWSFSERRLDLQRKKRWCEKCQHVEALILSLAIEQQHQKRWVSSRLNASKGCLETDNHDIGSRHIDIKRCGWSCSHTEGVSFCDQLVDNHLVTILGWVLKTFWSATEKIFMPGAEVGSMTTSW